MSLQTFTSRWLGRRTDQDGVFGYQCVDLIKTYAVEELGMTPGPWGNAIDYWTNVNHPLNAKYNRVASQSPEGGDIVILNPTSTNPYGHIGIAVDSMTMLEQNGYSGDGDGMGGDEIRHRLIPKSRIAGLLRPKGGSMSDAARIKDLEASEQRLANEVVVRDKIIASHEARIKQLEASEQNLAQEVVKRDKIIADLEAGGDSAAQEKLNQIKEIVG